MNNKISSKTRIIRLYRDGSTQLGFSIRGGWEHGTGIFVSEVHSGSEAAKQGLQAGDQIVRINGFSLEHAIHDDVIALVKSSSKVTLKVKSVGMVPIRDRLTEVLTWKLLAPPSASPSPLNSASPSPPWTSSDSHSDSEHDFLEANIFIDLKDRSLGCSVVKGPPNCPGIFVQSIKLGEIAEQSGLEVGDQIIQVNSVNVSLMEFSDAISKLKSLPEMTLTVKKGAGRHLFGVAINSKNNCLINGHYNSDNNIKANNNNNNIFNHKTDNCAQKKKVTAIVHHPGNTNGTSTHSRMLSSGSICSGSESSSSSGLLNGKSNSNNSNHIYSENDFSISEMESNGSGGEKSIQNVNNKINFINNNNNVINNNCNKNSTNSLLNESTIKILEKVKIEEERLAEERRKLEEEQHRLRLEMQKLELERKELERRKQLDECNSLSNCSLSSASAASSSGSQSISFLEEIKALGDHSKRNLRPVNSADNNRISSNRLINNKTNDTNSCTKSIDKSPKVVTPNSKSGDVGDDKHKQHELLMEEFRRAHRRMFGESDNILDKTDKNSIKVIESQQNGTKDVLKESKSLPITTLTAPVVKTPPAVPVKKCSTGPVVQIGTYANNSYTNNRFVGQTHRSVIQFRSDDSKDCSNDNKPNNSDKTNSQITIKVISTKQ